MRTLVFLTCLTGLFAGCQSASDESEAKLTNAKQTIEFPAVAKFKNRSGIGTMSFITKNIAITAAHNTYSQEGSKWASPSKDVGATRVYNHPLYQQEIDSTGLKYNYYEASSGNNKGSFDLALIEFPEGIDDAQVAYLSPLPIKDGTEVTLVGYGDNDAKAGTGFGVKRTGVNTFNPPDASEAEKTRVAKYKIQGMITLFGEDQSDSDTNELGQNVATATGDSGGPLLISGKNEDGTTTEVVVGIVHGGFNVKEEPNVKGSLFVDLLSDQSISFLSRAVEREKFAIPSTCCLCDKHYFTEINLLPDQMFDEELSVPAAGVGHLFTEQLCINLNHVRHPILPQDEFYNKSEKRYYRTENCTHNEKTVCEEAFGPNF